MKRTTDKEYKEFLEYKADKLHGRILTPDGLRFICSANKYDPQKIGEYFLDLLPRITTPRG